MQRYDIIIELHRNMQWAMRLDFRKNMCSDRSKPFRLTIGYVCGKNLEYSTKCHL